MSRFEKITSLKFSPKISWNNDPVFGHIKIALGLCAEKFVEARGPDYLRSLKFNDSLIECIGDWFPAGFAALGKQFEDKKKLGSALGSRAQACLPRHQSGSDELDRFRLPGYYNSFEFVASSIDSKTIKVDDCRHACEKNLSKMFEDEPGVYILGLDNDKTRGYIGQATSLSERADNRPGFYWAAAYSSVSNEIAKRFENQIFYDIKCGRIPIENPRDWSNPKNRGYFRTTDGQDFIEVMQKHIKPMAHFYNKWSNGLNGDAS
jgi:hypothetical protein